MRPLPDTCHKLRWAAHVILSEMSARAAKGGKKGRSGRPQKVVSVNRDGQARGRRHQIAQVLTQRFAEHAKLLDRLGAGGMAESGELVHDFRVSTRQLLASLAMLETIVRPRGQDLHSLEQLRKRLKKPFKELGPVRDLEVVVEHLVHMVKHEPTLGRLHAAVRAEHERKARKALAGVRDKRVPRALKAVALHRDAVIAQLAEVDEKAAGARLARALLERQRRARGCWNKLRTSHPSTFHELRIALKHLRYQSAFIADLSGPHRKLAKSVVSDCRTLQQELGEVQDLTVLLQMARTDGQTPPPALRGIKLRRKERMAAVVKARPVLIDTLVRARALAAAMRIEGKQRGRV